MKKKLDFHESFDREEVAEGSSNRFFGIVFSIFFGIVGLFPLAHGSAPRLWALAVAAAFLVVALVKPSLLQPLNRVWKKLGVLLSKLARPVAMGIIFYLVVTPLGFLARLSGRDLLRLRFDRDARSYWIKREPPGPAPETMRNQF